MADRPALLMTAFGPTRRSAFLCVSIDCECDKGPGWVTQWPLQFEGVHVGIGQRLEPLFRHYAAKPTYLLSPELLRDGRCLELLAGLRGCELGTHLHGEMADPDAFVPAVTRTVQRDYAPGVEKAKLDWLTGAFRGAFARSPRTHRAGRFGIGPRTLPILEELGYTVDSSVTPHVEWHRVSPGLSFLGAPTQPYHPDPADAARPGLSSLVEVPLTIQRGAPLLPMLRRRWPARWLRPTKTSGRQLVAIARETIAESLGGHPRLPVFLNLMLHNVEVIPRASPYARTAAEADRILARLGTLLAWALREGIRCVGLADVPDLLDARS